MKNEIVGTIKNMSSFESNRFAAAPVIWNVAKGAYDSYQNKKDNDKLVAERKRLNDALIAGKVKLSPVRKMNADETLGKGVKKRTRRKPKGEGLYMNKKLKALGGGVKKKKQTKGKGLYRNKKPKQLGGGIQKKKQTKGKVLYVNKKPKALLVKELMRMFLRKLLNNFKKAVKHFDLEYLAEKFEIPYFRGVFMIDTLLKKPEENESAIVNLDIGYVIIKKGLQKITMTVLLICLQQK